MSGEVVWGVGPPSVRMCFAIEDDILFAAKITVDGNTPAVVIEPLVFLPFHPEKYRLQIDIPELHQNHSWTLDPFCRGAPLEVSPQDLPEGVGRDRPVGVTISIHLHKIGSRVM